MKLLTCAAAALFLAQPGRALGATAFTSIVIDGRTNAVAMASLSLAVPVDARLVEIYYTNPDLTQPAEGHFRYRLNGFASGWTDVGNARVASFTNLPAGHYAFEVQSADSTGKWTQ